MKEKKYTLILLILSLVFLLISSLPLLHNDFILTHDNTLYPILLYEFDQGIQAGQWLPRWSADFWLGLGSPFFNFIQPLFFYLAEIFHLIGFNFIISIKLVVILGIILGFLFMYLFAKTIWGREGGFISAVIYTFFPYRLALVYIRGDFTEYFATSLIPLVLYAFIRLAQTKKMKYFLLSSLALALLIITHNIQTLFFLPLLFFYLIYIFWQEIKKVILPSVLSVIFSFSLVAFFIFPAFFERQFIAAEALARGRYDFHLNFINFSNLILAHWSMEEFFQIGILGIFIFIAVVLIFLTSHRQLGGFERKNFNFFILVILATSLLTLPISVIFWERMPLVKFTQFPWRVLSFQVLAFGVLGGILFQTKVSQRLFKKKLAPILLVIIFSSIIVFANYDFTRPFAYLKIEGDDSYHPYLQAFKDVENIKILKEKNITELDFFILQHVLPNIVPRGVEVENAQQEIGRIIAAVAASGDEKEKEKLFSKINILKGELDWQYQKLTPIAFNLILDSKEESTILVNQFWFPGWQAYLDGRKININHDNNLQIMTFVIPEGNHLLELRFTNTFLRSFSEIISLLALAIWLTLLYKTVIKRQAV